MQTEIIIVGYSGHAYVVCDIFLQMKVNLTGYTDAAEKSFNPFQLTYFGDERKQEVVEKLANKNFFISIGENEIRKKVFQHLKAQHISFCNAIHPSSVIASSAEIGIGVMIGANATINPLAKIGDGVICNTGCIIEHENTIGDFVHLAPGSVLCGNVTVGESTFIGANSVVKQGINIGKNCVIGAGSVVLKNIPDNTIWVGNPAKQIKK